MARARRALGELDRVGDHSSIGRGVQIAELVEPEPQSGEDRRIEARGVAFGEPLDEVVEGALALHRPVAEAHRERAVAPVERRGARVQRAVGELVVLEDTAQHVVRAAARGSDGRL